MKFSIRLVLVENEIVDTWGKQVVDEDREAKEVGKQGDWWKVSKAASISVFSSVHNCHS